MPSLIWKTEEHGGILNHVAAAIAKLHFFESEFFFKSEFFLRASELKNSIFKIVRL